MPKISVIIPTHNRAYILWKAIQSVQSQTFSDWELIIVDDHSTDDTLKLMREFRHDSRIKIVTSDYKHSAAGARKTGCRVAKGEFIAYLDSDNYAFSHWLALSVKTLIQNHNKVVAFCGLNAQVGKLEKDGSIAIYKQSAGYNYLIDEEAILTHQFEGDSNGMIHRSSILGEIEGWDVKLTNYDDYDFVIQTILQYPNGVLYLPNVCIEYYRLYGEEGVCNNMSYTEIILLMEYIYNKHITNPKWKKLSSFPAKINEYKKLEKAGLAPIEHIQNKYNPIINF
jgi:glycosyltransferase involved in cell wall biosynthesis